MQYQIDLNGHSITSNEELQDEKEEPVFYIARNNSLSITNSSDETSRISGGHSRSYSSDNGNFLAYCGGGFYNRGYLSLENVELCDNVAMAGAGIYNEAQSNARVNIYSGTKIYGNNGSYVVQGETCND